MVKKELGLPSVIATGVGLIVTTGCFMLIGQEAGSIGLSFLLAMVFALFINILTGLCMAELNALMPNLTGGLAQYSLAGVGPFLTLVMMVGGYIVCNIVAGSAECAVFGNTVNVAFHTGLTPEMICVILLIVLIAINLFGVDIFAKVQNLVAYALIFSVMILGAIGAFGLGTGEIVEQPLFKAMDLGTIASYTGAAFFLFLGCEYCLPIAPSVKNARRNLPLGMVMCILIVFTMDVFVIFGMAHYTPWAELKASATPHILYGFSLLGEIGKMWMVAVSVFAVISTLNTSINAIAYICAGMAKIGLLPSFFMRRNRFRSPYIGILFVGGIMIAICMLGISTASAISMLLLIGSVFWLSAYTMSSLNVILFRRRQPKTPRTFKVPGGYIIPVIALLGNLFMMYNISADPVERLTIYKTVAVVFAGFAIYAGIWCRMVMKIPLFRPVPIKTIMAMENELYYVVRHPEHRKN